jgi:ubiquinone/menaquinone biosynthesis C-methylase UbiE
MELRLSETGDLRNRVRDRYGAIAKRVSEGDSCGCGCGSNDENPVTDGLYAEHETLGIPSRAVMSSLGCGNPTSLATLKEGDVVLDLGSGGGLDALLAARRVGPTGKVIGLDMTNQMLELAGSNLAESEVENVEFIKGSIEDIPLPDESVDIVISNCVINLASDKSAVLREAYRVLRPGGRFAVSDIVARRSVPADIQSSAAMVLGCMGGNLLESEYREKLAQAGFRDVEIEPTNVYSADALYTLGAKGEESILDGLFMSAFVRAKK